MCEEQNFIRMKQKIKKTFFIRFLLWVKHCIVYSGIVHETK